MKALPKLVGLIGAFIALIFGVLHQINPMAALQRGVIAFVIAWISGSLFVAFLDKQHNQR